MRNTERLFLIGLIPFTAVLGLVGHELSNMAIEAQVSQAAYQCEMGDERVCYKLALWTGGDCASPRMIGGCQSDSYVNDSEMIVSNRPLGAVHDQEKDSTSAEHKERAQCGPVSLYRTTHHRSTSLKSRAHLSRAAMHSGRLNPSIGSSMARIGLDTISTQIGGA
jgi:uncharacterized membrane protein